MLRSDSIDHRYPFTFVLNCYAESDRDALAMVNDPRLSRVVIVGARGSGKTTVLRAALLQWADRPEDQLPDTDLPLLIELGPFAEALRSEPVCSPVEFWQQRCPPNWGLDPTVFQQWLRAGRIALFGDGLDRIPDPNLREDVLAAMHRFLETYPRCRIVITCYCPEQQPSWEVTKILDSLTLPGDEDFRADLKLQPFTDAQISVFLQKWGQSVSTRDCGPQGNTPHDRLAQAIAASPAVRELAGNPMLLTLFAVLNQQAELPLHRAGLLGACGQLVLAHWCPGYSLPAPDNMVQTEPLARATLKRSHSARYRPCDAGRLKTGLCQLTNRSAAGGGHRGDSPGCALQASPPVAQAILCSVRESGGLLVPLGDGVWTFAHPLLSGIFLGRRPARPFCRGAEY